MKSAVVFLLVFILPFSTAIVDCIIACNRCKERVKDLELTEVYCAMCTECKERRKEWLTSFKPEHRRANGEASVEDECLTQPPCDSEEVIKLKGASSTTTRKPCPPVTPCKQITTPYQATTLKPCCMPMYIYPMPMCSPCTYPQTSFQPLAQRVEVSTVTNTDSVYLYIGVPKNIVKTGK